MPEWNIVENQISPLQPADFDIKVGEILHLKAVDDYLGLYRRMLTELRLKFPTAFDMPSQQFLAEIKEHFVTQASRTTIFDRMVSRPSSNDPTAPVIIARWNMNANHGPFFLQLGIAVPEENKILYLHRTIIRERNEKETPQPPQSETPNLAENQEEAYWELVFTAATRSVQERVYPFACLIEPMGKFGPIIVARNRNWEPGQSFEGHAEHLALTQMNDMGYKMHDALPYTPVVHALVAPCHACCQMMREQGVKELHSILDQPGNGTAVLLNPKLTSDYGPPPTITRVTNPQLRKKALQIVREANEIFPGQFEETLAMNEGIS